MTRAPLSVALRLLGAAALATTSAVTSAHGFTSAPHAAFYDIALLETRVGEVTSVDGGMRLEVTASCDAWTVASELRLISGNDSGAGVNLRVLYEGSEATDGSEFRFRTDVFVNGMLEEEIEGRATRDEGGRGNAEFSLPEENAIALPADTVFPLQALDQSLQAFFQDGKLLNNYVYFDGSTVGLDRGTDLVAGTPDPVTANQADPDGLLTGAPKRVVTTMFDMVETDAEPRSTFIGDLMPNGVLSRLTIDLGFILVEAKLAEVEANPVPSDCP